MKQSLQLKTGQHLTMTPQLHQAIRILQLSYLDLQQEIQQALYNNPLLELVEEEEDLSTQNTDDFKNQGSASDTIDTQNSASNPDAAIAESEQQWNNEIPEHLPVDAEWGDVFQETAATTGNQSININDNQDIDTFYSITDSLQDHLTWQLNLAPMSDRDRIIAAAVIDSIGDDGFLDTPITDIWQGLSSILTDPEDKLELDEVETVLHRIQNFDPVGAGSRTLKECLSVQLNQLPEQTPLRTEAQTLVEHHLELVASRDYKQIKRETGLTNDTIKNAIKLIQELSPRPGDAIQNTNIEYVIPEVRVIKRDKQWQIILNEDTTSNLRINDSYAQLIRRSDSSEQNHFLRNNLREARNFLRSIEGRNETLMRVSSAIMEMQHGFLEYGHEAMKPMVLADIANHLELNESTVSRITTQKYIDTPRGVYELKYFFSSHVGTTGSNQCSSTAIRAMLKKMIAKEDPAKPLSDSKLVSALKDKGIEVARRTIAKYRQSLNIPSSSERKK